jgi:hypothetical protein
MIHGIVSVQERVSLLYVSFAVIDDADVIYVPTFEL